MRHTANINDPDSIKKIYALADFERDAIRNSLAKMDRHFGLLIDAAPDSEGRFYVHVGIHAMAHNDLRAGAAFVCPYMGKDYASFYLVGGNMGEVREHGDIFDLDEEGGYERFVRIVIEAAREMPVIPPMDPFRLANFE